MIKHTELIAFLETNSVTIIIFSTLAWYYNPFQSECDSIVGGRRQVGMGEDGERQMFPFYWFWEASSLPDGTSWGKLFSSQDLIKISERKSAKHLKGRHG